MAQEEKIIPERWRDVYETAKLYSGNSGSTNYQRVRMLIEELGAAESALSIQSTEMARVKAALRLACVKIDTLSNPNHPCPNPDTCPDPDYIADALLRKVDDCGALSAEISRLREALEKIASNEGECCQRCEGSGELWADRKAHLPSYSGPTVNCESCDGNGRIFPDVKEIAKAALLEMRAI